MAQWIGQHWVQAELHDGLCRGAALPAAHRASDRPLAHGALRTSPAALGQRWGSPALSGPHRPGQWALMGPWEPPLLSPVALHGCGLLAVGHQGEGVSFF